MKTGRLVIGLYAIPGLVAACYGLNVEAVWLYAGLFTASMILWRAY